MIVPSGKVSFPSRYASIATSLAIVCPVDRAHRRRFGQNTTVPIEPDARRRIYWTKVLIDTFGEATMVARASDQEIRLQGVGGFDRSRDAEMSRQPIRGFFIVSAASLPPKHREWPGRLLRAFPDACDGPHQQRYEAARTSTGGTNPPGNCAKHH
jgi:hypothetical protein